MTANAVPEPALPMDDATVPTGAPGDALAIVMPVIWPVFVLPVFFVKKLPPLPDPLVFASYGTVLLRV